MFELNDKVIIKKNNLRGTVIDVSEYLDGIVYTVEKELGIELVGDEKVKIAIDENEDPWDEILDDNEDKIIDNEVNEDFIDDTDTL